MNFADVSIQFYTLLEDALHIDSEPKVKFNENFEYFPMGWTSGKKNYMEDAKNIYFDQE